MSAVILAGTNSAPTESEDADRSWLVASLPNDSAETRNGPSLRASKHRAVAMPTMCVAVDDFVVRANLNEPSPRGLDGPRGSGGTGLSIKLSSRSIIVEEEPNF